MSVIIKGMEMPQDCFSCPLREKDFVISLITMLRIFIKEIAIVRS